MRKSVAALGGIVLVVGAACHSTTAPSLSGTSTSTSTVSAPALTGVVMEGTRPLAGVRVVPGVSAPGREVVTDANGAFQLPGILGLAEWWLLAIKDGYAQPCAVRVAGNGPFTIQMVSRAALTGEPLSSPSGFRTVSGVVRQMTSGTLQGVEGATVFFAPDPTNTDWDAAYTVTDSSGRFSLCGLPQAAVFLEAFLRSFADVTVPPDQTFIEIDLH